MKTNKNSDIKIFENTVLVGLLMAFFTFLVAAGYVFYFGTWRTSKISEKLEANLPTFIQERFTRPNVMLQLDSESEQLFAGELVEVALKISSEEIALSGADIGISYPRDLLEFKDVVKGSSFDQLLKKINEADGELYISVLMTPTKVFKGSGKLATIVFEAQKEGRGDIDFLKGDGFAVAPAEPDSSFRTKYSSGVALEIKEATETAQSIQ